MEIGIEMEIEIEMAIERGIEMEIRIGTEKEIDAVMMRRGTVTINMCRVKSIRLESRDAGRNN